MLRAEAKRALSAVPEEFASPGDGGPCGFAPTSLPDKERASVSAGREIAPKVQALGGTAESETTISVGVGVATREAFVGNVQEVDRMIWRDRVELGEGR